MKIRCNPIPTFNMPESTYLAELVEVRQQQETGDNGLKEMARFLWHIKDQTGSYVEYMAGKTYEANLEAGSFLRNDLETWGVLSDPYTGDFDLDSLVGKKANIVIRHYKSGTHKNPFCKIIAVLPANCGVQVAPQMAA